MNKKIVSLITLSLLVALHYLNAVTVVYTIPAGVVWNATNLFTTPKSATVTKVTVNTGSGTVATNLTYALLDFPGFDASKGWGLLVRTNAAYTNVNSYLTNLSKIVTNFGSGDGNGNYVTSTNTFTNALYTYSQTVGQTSNAWRDVANGTIGSNSTVTAVQGDFPVIYGLGLTNNNIGFPIIVTVEYEPGL